MRYRIMRQEPLCRKKADKIRIVAMKGAESGQKEIRAALSRLFLCRVPRTWKEEDCRKRPRGWEIQMEHNPLHPAAVNAAAADFRKRRILLKAEDIREMLKKVAAGELSVDNAVLELKKEPFTAAGYDDLGFAKLDTHRKLRQGAAEVIYGAGKTPEQIAGIVEAMKKRGQETILITRVDEEKSRETEKLLSEIYPDGSGYRYFKDAKVAICGSFRKTALEPSSWRPAEPVIFRLRRRRHSRRRLWGIRWNVFMM